MDDGGLGGREREGEAAVGEVLLRAVAAGPVAVAAHGGAAEGDAAGGGDVVVCLLQDDHLCVGVAAVRGDSYRCVDGLGCGPALLLARRR